MGSTYYILEAIPDLTLSKYASLDESGVNGVLSHHSTFWRQMNRRGLLQPGNAFHLFYEYDPERSQGERLRVGIRFDMDGTAGESYLRETIESSPLSPFYEFREAGSLRTPGSPEKGAYPFPNLSRRYAYSMHLTRKERRSRPLDPGSAERYYTVSEWKMNKEARLYDMARLMESIGRPCLYVLSAYPVDMAETLEETLSYVLPKLRKLTRAKVSVSSSGAGLGQKDENADDTLHYYIDLLESLAANPHFICDIQVLSDDYIHAGYILDAAASEALAEGDHTLKPTSGCSLAEIGSHSFRYLAMEGAPQSLNYLSQLFLLDEMVPFGILPALYSGETVETPKETLPDLDARGLVLGTDPDRHRIEFPLGNLSKHAFLAGVPGSGKTNSMMHLIHEMHAGHGIPVLVLEPAKHEYRVMTTLPDLGDLELFSPSAFTRFPLHINPFEFPKGLTLAEHIRNLLAVFDGAFNLEPPMPFLLDRSVEDVYRDHNWTHNMINRGTLSYPTMRELYEKLEKRLDASDYAPEVRSNLKSALQVRIGSLMTREMGDIFDVPRSTVPPEEWIRRSAIVELESLGTDPANYMTLLIATLIRETLKVENYDKEALGGKPRHVMFLEEAHNLIGPVAQPSAGADADPKTAATAYIVRMLAEVRALGEGIVIADQLPTAMAPEVIKNTSLKIGLRITAQDDRSLLGGTMSANPDQMEKMAVFTPGQALCSYEPLLKPFEIQIPYFAAKEGNLDDAVILQHLGSLDGYHRDLLASLDISSEGWKKRWEMISKHKEEFLKSVRIYERQKESSSSYDPESKGFVQHENEMKKLLKQLRQASAGIIQEANELLISLYAYYSPFAAVFETKNAFGAQEESERFRVRFRKMVSKELLTYKKRVETLEQDLDKEGFRMSGEYSEKMKQRRQILSVCPQEEKELWTKAAAR
ncbi:MAG: hypothetical protein Q4D81_03665 [Eubacteriales bacterium]|nr:hypothetical protein [Eubacteriales bacterium]